MERTSETASGQSRQTCRLDPEQTAEAQKEADEVNAKAGGQKWTLIFNGKGRSICTIKDYGDFEMYVDWKIGPRATAAFIRGSPQVQIWDSNKVGSGGLYNNQKNPSNPIKAADKPIGQWNSFYIKMVGDASP